MKTKYFILIIILLKIFFVGGDIIGNVYIGAFKPLDIPNCATWLDGADLSTISLRAGTDYVTQWSDKSGNGANATQGTEAAQPTLVYNYVNGRNAISFNGHKLNFANYVLPYLDESYTYFAVVKPATINTTTAFLRAGSNYTPAVFILLFQGTHFSQTWYGLYLTGDVVSANNWHICFADYDGTTRKNILDGGDIYSDVPGVPCENTGTNSWISSNGDIFYWAELIVYNRALSTAEREQVESYLTNKWGI